MVPFAGFEMPVQYEGVLAEHAAVREKVGLFDITHMGEIFVTGPGAEAWLDGLVTNRVARPRAGQGRLHRHVPARTAASWTTCWSTAWPTSDGWSSATRPTTTRSSPG